MRALRPASALPYPPGYTLPRLLRPMSTVTLPSPLPPVPVHLPPNLSSSQLLSFSPFSSWLSTLTHSLSLQSSPTHTFHAAPYALHSLNIQSADFFGPPTNRRLGFLKLQAEIKNAHGETLPGSVFLRGGSVAILLLLEVDGGKEGAEWVVLTVQPRIPAGSLEMVELPAGMLESGSFAGAAAKELQEECGITIQEEHLLDLTALSLQGLSSGQKEQLRDAVYTSPGGSDEYLKIFAYVHRIGQDTLSEWQGKLTGLRDHGEKITLKVVRFQDLWRETRDAKALSAMALWERLKREGMV